MPLRDNMEKYGRTVQSTDGNIILTKRFESWLIKDINTHSKCVTFIAFQRQQRLCQTASKLGLSEHDLSFFQ